MSESEIHLSRWIFERKSKNWLIFFICSFILHASFFYFLSLIKPKAEIVSEGPSSSIKINIPNEESLPDSNKKKIIHEFEQENLKPEKSHREILTDTNKNSQSHFSALNKELEDKPSPRDKKQLSKRNDLNSFLPKMDSDSIKNIWNKNQQKRNSSLTDGGDIPIEGPSLAPTNEPRVIARYGEKDLSLLQFTQQFRERFGAIWNSEERMVPPSSPLHPGDIVYYKVYINSNGKLEKYENLTQKDHPQIDYSDVDKLFNGVISNVFPMVVPPKFANKNITLTETIAIQVVDKSAPARMSFN